MPDFPQNSAPPVPLANPIGFDEDPLIKISNQRAMEDHAEKTIPVVATVGIARPVCIGWALSPGGTII